MIHKSNLSDVDSLKDAGTNSWYVVLERIHFLFHCKQVSL